MGGGKERKKEKKKCASSQNPKVILSVLLFVRLAGLEGHLQDLVPQTVSVEAGDGHGRLFVIGHCDKAKASAFVGVEVADDFDIGDRAEWAEHLPQQAFIAILTQIVNENAPARG